MWCRSLFFFFSQNCIQNLILLCTTLAFLCFYNILRVFLSDFGDDVNYRIYDRIVLLIFTIGFQKLALNACYRENPIHNSTIEFTIELRGVTIEFHSLTFRVLDMHRTTTA